jgi:hypothetical protein
MSGTVRDDIDFLGEQLLKKSQTQPLREQMEAFLEEHEPADELKSLRQRAKDGENLSEIVKRDRDERM